MKNYKNIVDFSLIIILGIIIALLFKYFQDNLNDEAITLIFVSYCLFSVGLIFKIKYLSFIGYFIALITILFVRDTKDAKFSDGKYIYDWMKIIFTNKIVFINVIGNLVLYVPFMIYLMKTRIKRLYSLLIVISIIIICEYGQYLWALGVFDFIDIILNALGCIITLLMYEVIICIEKKKKINVMKR